MIDTDVLVRFAHASNEGLNQQVQMDSLTRALAARDVRMTPYYICKLSSTMYVK